MNTNAMMARTTATPTTAAVSFSTWFRRARMVHGGTASSPERPSAKARNWAVLAEGSWSRSRMPLTVSTLAGSSSAL